MTMYTSGSSEEGTGEWYLCRKPKGSAARRSRATADQADRVAVDDEGALGQRPSAAAQGVRRALVPAEPDDELACLQAPEQMLGQAWKVAGGGSRRALEPEERRMHFVPGAGAERLPEHARARLLHSLEERRELGVLVAVEEPEARPAPVT